MKFIRRITSMGTLKKQDFYDFEISVMQQEEAMKRTYENPLIINDGGSIITLYSEKGKLRMNYFISYYGFEEGFGTHNPKEYNNVVLCSCGKRFPQGKKKLGMINFEKHFKEVEEIKKKDANEEDDGGKK